jgi:NAD(P)H-hydrate repair Nnr-like enzyme with NAD(P)H-hydrate epimerase domain
MRLTDLVTAGPALDAYLAQLMKVAGEAVASMIKALATFEVTEIRPLLDMGQGWEQSI